jgi:hypothetical protein
MCASEIEEGREGAGAVGLEAASAEDLKSLVAGIGLQLGDNPGFAHPRFASDQDWSRISLPRLIECLTQVREKRVPTDDNWTDHRLGRWWRPLPHHLLIFHSMT